MQKRLLLRALVALLFLSHLGLAQRLFIPNRGVNVHTAQFSSLDSVMQMHFNWVRVDLGWFYIQPTEYGAFAWDETDRAVEAAVSRGLRIYGNFTTTPAWACRAGDSGKSCVPRSSVEWQTFVRRVALRYRGAISVYGIGNEPDNSTFWNGNATEYATIVLAPGASTLRAADPSALIAAPDLSGSWGAHIPASEIFDAMTAVNAGSLIDIVSIHAYEDSNIFGSLTGPNGILDKVYNGNSGARLLLYWVDRNGDLAAKPVWITEFGFAGGGDNAPSGGTAVEKTFELFGPRDRVTGLFDFQLEDDSTATPPVTVGLLYANNGGWKTGAFYLRDHMPYDDYVADPPVLRDRFDFPWSGLYHRWNFPIGGAQLAGGALTSTVQGFAAKITAAPQTDFSIEETVRITNSLGSSTNWVGLLGRTPSLNGTYSGGGYLGFLRANGQAGLYTPAGLNQTFQTNVDPVNSYVRLKLTGVGTRISLAVNGVEVIVATDSSYNSGYSGLQNYANGTNDNVILRSPSTQYSRPDPLAFYSVTPCRMIDTRNTTAIAAGLPTRRFAAWGNCSIPTSAVSLVANITATGETGAGSFRVFPAGFGLPAAAFTAFPAGVTRASIASAYVNAPASAPGAFDVYYDATPGNSAHFIFDVSGYFAPSTGQ